MNTIEVDVAIIGAGTVLEPATRSEMVIDRLKKFDLVG